MPARAEFCLPLFLATDSATWQMRQLPAVKDGLISALLYAPLLFLPQTHRTACPGHMKYCPMMSGFNFWLFFQLSSDDVDLEVGREVLSAFPLLPHVSTWKNFLVVIRLMSLPSCDVHRPKTKDEQEKGALLFSL